MDKGVKFGLIVSVLSVALSVGGSLTANSYRQGSVDTRLEVLEAAESLNLGVNTRVVVLESEANSQALQLQQQMASIAAIGKATQALSDRVGAVETNLAVTASVLTQLTKAVEDLAGHTNNLSVIITKVAVLEQQVTDIRGDR
jgi:hypothetical protein